LKDFLCGGERRVPAGPLPSVNPLETWRRGAQSGLRATWLGHSTVLLEIDGWRVLTDPVWGPRASPSRFIGPKRFQPVPVALSELPPLDAVLVSHDH
ncbi:MAG: MBL fold metallo-hydrolase, partial [Sphingomonas sp.]